MKNRIKLGLAGLASLLVLSLTTNAQSVDKKSTTTSSDKPKWVLSVGPDAGLPIGDYKDFYDWSIGGSIQADYAILQRQLYVVVNAGYSDLMAKDVAGLKGTDLQLIPVKAGLRYYPLTSVSKLYIQGLAGVNILTNKSDVGASKSAAFVYAPQIGYLFPLGGSGKSFLDVGVKFEGTSAFTDGGSQYNSLGLHVAYAFGL